MFAQAPATPRPIAPGRAKRKVPASGGRGDTKQSPPPPYDRQGSDARSRPDNLLGSPVPMTTQMVEYFASGARSPGEGSPAPEQWVDEQSQQEMRNLLARAEEAIQERENELSWASNVCKGLYQENKQLKEKHQNLLARLPGSPGISPAPSPRTSGVFHFSSSSLSSFAALASPTFSATELSPNTALSARSASTRRISVSPAELAQLADENAELLQKLEGLEHESAHADLAGRRKLRDLEREIAGLRAELDRTRTRSAELEAQAQERENAAMRRREREKGPQEQPRRRTESESQPHDFAPAGMMMPQTPGRPAAAHRHTSPAIAVVSSSPSEKLPLQDIVSPIAEEDETTGVPFRYPSIQSPDANAPDTASPKAPEPPAALPAERLHEYEVVSQLLSKIRELEDTNTEIAAAQRDTSTRLRTAQRDTEGIRRLYAVFGADDDAEVEVVLDEDGDDADGPSLSPPGGTPARVATIRFKSIRRTIEGDMARLHLAADNDPFFDSGIQPAMRSTMDGERRPSMGGKPRRTVVGLFDPLAEDDAAGGLSDLSLELSLDQEDVDDNSPTISRRVLGFGLDGVDPSEVLSPTSFEPDWSRFRSSPAPVGHSLGSEIGSDYGDGEELGTHLGLSGDNHHLQRSSLYDLAQFQEGNSVADALFASPSPSSLSLNTRVGPESMSHSNNTVMPGGLVIIPPTPQSLRSRRLNTVVRSRAGRWAESRFGSLNVNPFASRSRVPSASETVAGTPTPTTSTFLRASLDAVAVVVADRLSGENEDDAVSVDATSTELSSSTTAHDLGTTAPEAEDEALLSPLSARRKRAGVTQVTMELFLWIQFLLIILVFVFTMVRKGPHVFDQPRRKLHA